MTDYSNRELFQPADPSKIEYFREIAARPHGKATLYRFGIVMDEEGNFYHDGRWLLGVKTR